MSLDNPSNTMKRKLNQRIKKELYQHCQGSPLVQIHLEQQCKHDGLGPHVQVVRLRDQGLEAPSNESSQIPPTTKHPYREAYHLVLPHLLEDLIFHFQIKYLIFIFRKMNYKHCLTKQGKSETYPKGSGKNQVTFRGFHKVLQHGEFLKLQYLHQSKLQKVA